MLIIIYEHNNTLEPNSYRAFCVGVIAGLSNKFKCVVVCIGACMHVYMCMCGCECSWGGGCTYACVYLYKIQFNVGNLSMHDSTLFLSNNGYNNCEMIQMPYTAAMLQVLTQCL